MELIDSITSYWKLDGNSTDSVGSNNGTDTDISYTYVYEDFTTYTKVDPNSRITVTASKVSFAGLASNESAYVYKDKGANYFAGNFTHKFDCKFTAHTSNDEQNTVWAIADYVGTFYPDVYTNGNGIGLAQYNTGGVYYLYLYEYTGGANYNSNHSISVNTPYYITVRRDTSVGTYGTIYFDVYTDAARTSLSFTLSQALHANLGYRYLYAISSINAGNSANVTGYTQNFVLSESDSSGKIGQGAGFNGTTSKIVMGNVSVGANATFSAWFKTTQNANYPMVFAASDGAKQLGLFFSNQKIQAYANDSNNVEDSVVSSSNMNDGNWHFSVCVKTGNTLELFVDGASQGTDTHTFTGNFNNIPIAISNSTNTAYSGAVDECGYWSRALTSGEVKQLYNNGLGIQYPFSGITTLTLGYGSFALTGESTVREYKKFKVINSWPVKNCFEYQTILETTDIDAQWEISAEGTNMVPATQEPTYIINKPK